MASEFAHVVTCLASVSLFHVQPLSLLPHFTAAPPPCPHCTWRSWASSVSPSVSPALTRGTCQAGPRYSPVCSHRPHLFLRMYGNSTWSFPQWNWWDETFCLFLSGRHCGFMSSSWLGSLLPLADKCLPVPSKTEFKFLFLVLFLFGDELKREKKEVRQKVLISLS